MSNAVAAVKVLELALAAASTGVNLAALKAEYDAKRAAGMTDDEAIAYATGKLDSAIGEAQGAIDAARAGGAVA